jgi:hypothetical protein
VVRIDRLPAGGRSLEVSLDEATRASVAEALKLSALDRFEASLTVVPLRGGLRAQGRLIADIVQPSVVTFEPVGQHIDEPVDRVFLPEAQAHKPTPGSECSSTWKMRIFLTISTGPKSISVRYWWKPWRWPSIPIRAVRAKASKRWEWGAMVRPKALSPPWASSKSPPILTASIGHRACADSPMGYVCLPPGEAQNRPK